MLVLANRNINSGIYFIMFRIMLNLSKATPVDGIYVVLMKVEKGEDYIDSALQTCCNVCDDLLV